MEANEQPKKEKKRGGKLPVILAVVLAWVVLMASMAAILDARYVRFYLYGDETVTVECGDAFVDPGVYAVTAGRLFGESERHLPLSTLGEVDTSRVGSYVLRYTTRWAFSDYSTERTVNVVDTTPPVIELKTVEGYEPTWLTGYAEEGYTAYDICDGDLTGHVQRTAEADRIVYTVTDAAGNTATVERVLPKINYQPPVINLNGDQHMIVYASLNFTDPGFEAHDLLGNDLTDHVVCEGEVVPYAAGEYQLTYTITSDFGDTVTAVREVTVVPVEIPDTIMPGEKTIYLTFDDGPGPYTAGLLDVLKAYNVKATFFVTAANEKYFDQIGRAFREGHSIGVHSATHNYNKIYASEDAFFEDFFTMEDIIYDQTGSYTQLFRFPGGSSNTVSRFNPGIMSRLTKAMADMGYQYYDWNVSSGDAGETNKTNQIIENVKDGCSNFKTSVVLQHDIKDYSVAAVEEIIRWGMANGYTFRPLQLDSYAAHHGVNN
ncbi:MAG: polysaccharide deacetylase [Oscillospiraceae bacterium]|nr:polysaccharide deacetylase [Oscillospiraceae bacterium]